jgi:hypothetical protein
MNEKRKFSRYKCRIECTCGYFTGDPEKVNIIRDTPVNGSGLILDISRGGILIVTDDNPGVNVTAKVNFIIKNKSVQLIGRIVRTGMLQSNPAEVAKIHAAFSVHGKNYIALEFDMPIESISETDFV